MPELGAALASLGIIYSDEDIEAIHLQLEENFGAVNYVCVVERGDVLR